MDTIFTYQEAKRVFPEETRKIEEKIRSGKSKFKDVDFNEMKWSVCDCSVGYGMSVKREPSVGLILSDSKIETSTGLILSATYKNLYKGEFVRFFTKEGFKFLSNKMEI